MRGLFIVDRNLRLQDHPVLYKALEDCDEILFVSIWDDALQGISLEDLSHNGRTRLKALALFKQDLEAYGLQMFMIHGHYYQTIQGILQLGQFDRVYDVVGIEPWYRLVQSHLTEDLALKGIEYVLAQPNELVLPDQILKSDESPYKVFTPYYAKWQQLMALHKGYEGLEIPGTQLKAMARASVNLQHQMGQLIEDAFKVISPQSILSSELTVMTESECLAYWTQLSDTWFQAYGSVRDFPALEGTSLLSEYINRGTISLDKMVSDAMKLDGSEIWIRQLAWRDFYRQIMWHFPHAAKGPFKEFYRQLEWVEDLTLFEAWTQGRTGYPIVDAGMRQLVAEGRLHNRLRMVCATFLVKVLGINWQWGEAFFYKHLRDGDVCQNNGGWQWCASTGTDAQPYFRIFNPTLQQKKYDSQWVYVNRWLTPEDLSIEPIVDYKLVTGLTKNRYKSCESMHRQIEKSD